MCWGGVILFFVKLDSSPNDRNDIFIKTYAIFISRNGNQPHVMATVLKLTYMGKIRLFINLSLSREPFFVIM